MTEYMTEQEQIQQLKNWFKQYGFTIVLGVAIALCIHAGWRYWQHYHTNILMHASSVYDEMLTQRAQGNTSGAIAQAKKIQSHYARTPYAQMATFMLARDAVLKKNYPEAITQLKWVVDHGSDQSMRETARLRMARIFIAQKRPQDAIDLLKKIIDHDFIGLIDEVKGDAYLAMNDTASARTAYEHALKELPNAEITRPILQMKLDNLAV